MPEGFEAGDPQNWLEGRQSNPLSRLFSLLKDGYKDDFIPFEDGDSSYSSSSDDSAEILGL
jgi:hypothetical protein